MNIRSDNWMTSISDSMFFPSFFSFFLQIPIHAGLAPIASDISSQQNEQFWRK